MDWFDSDLSIFKGYCLSALKYAEENKYDVAVIDTAGRLHVDDELAGRLKT